MADTCGLNDARFPDDLSCGQIAKVMLTYACRIMDVL